MTIIYFILILGIIVFIHELGHFIFAKKAGIYVYEFSIGMGPQLFKWKRKNDETEYSIRLFPIGGFVQMAGEAVEVDENVPKEQRMQSKTWFQRFMTVIAGIMFNFILAIILFFIIGLVNGCPQNKPYVSYVDPDGNAYQAGLTEGSLITKIDNVKIKTYDRLLLEYQVRIGQDITFEIKDSNGETKTVVITPQEVNENDNITYKYGFNLSDSVKNGFLSSVKYAFSKTWSLIEQMFFTVVYLCTGKLSLGSLSGPVGIFTVVGDAAKMGFINLVYLLAFISVNVGFINFLPLPAFDGGRVLFLIIEKIIGKPVNPKVENTIHSIGMILLLLLMVIITYNDIIKLF
ncbi:MAG: RIP metalloprotease RseP [Firmicutes bacterium]|nr:RIP metalloprotease RseP [Bacillota bacterium]